MDENLEQSSELEYEANDIKRYARLLDLRKIDNNNNMYEKSMFRNACLTGISLGLLYQYFKYNNIDANQFQQMLIDGLTSFEELKNIVKSTPPIVWLLVVDFIKGIKRIATSLNKTKYEHALAESILEVPIGRTR